jgi:ubiquinone/menaquinone biosynthesis C-methylase UbiE
MGNSGGRAVAHDRTLPELLDFARQCWRQDQPEAALDAAWSAFEVAPDAGAVRALLVDLLRYYPAKLRSDRQTAYLRLLRDRNVEPDLINVAGWRLVFRTYGLAESLGGDAIGDLIAELERDELVLALLRESPVRFVAAERLMSFVRRSLLLSGRWRDYPDLVAALKLQASMNGGAWPFDESERGLIATQEGGPMIEAYLPFAERKGSSAAAKNADPVTRAVAAQYEGWPYPAWTRVTVGKQTHLPDTIRAMDPRLAERLPVAAKMLIAGCGTGRQAASVALHYPDATITAIDISEASLNYARQQCTALGITNVRFLNLDLHQVAELKQRFHAIHCTGVLHHLPDPERGLELLAGVLVSGGVMRIMLYNRYQRLMVSGARAFLMGDLAQEPVSDDMLRRVRQRFLQQPEHPATASVVRSRDFATLAGSYDLLLHRHEDPFDFPRIERSLGRAGMRMLSYEMQSPVIAARYDAMFPNDPKHRDITSLVRFEARDHGIRQNHYRFWCYIPPESD